LSLQRVEHRRRGPVHHRRHCGRRRGDGRRCAQQPPHRRAHPPGCACGRGGMAWAGIVAFLRDRANANEILVSLMLVYVAEMLLSYLVYGPWKDPAGYNFPQTITFLKSTQMPRLFTGFRVNGGVIIALLAVAAFWVLLFRTYAGFQLQVGGLAPAAARYAGFSSRNALWLSALLSCGMGG